VRFNAGALSRGATHGKGGGVGEGIRQELNEGMKVFPELQFSNSQELLCLKRETDFRKVQSAEKGEIQGLVAAVRSTFLN
jgi:hypothetical protein